MEKNLNARNFVLSCHVILSKSIKIRQFEIKNFLWRGHGPLHRPSPIGEWTPLPKPYPLGAFGASFASDRAYGARVYLPPLPAPDPALPPGVDFLDASNRNRIVVVNIAY